MSSTASRLPLSQDELRFIEELERAGALVNMDPQRVPDGGSATVISCFDSQTSMVFIETFAEHTKA